MQKSLKVAFLTLGCKVNQSETEAMEGLFRQRGHEVVPFTERADAYVVNTCSVTAASSRKSRQMIRRARRLNGQAVLAVTGCHAQLSPAEVAAMEGVRIVLGTKDRGKIVDYVERALQEDGLLGTVEDALGTREFEDIPLFGMPARTRAFLKIEDGCENFCSYCIIPYARGPVRSLPLPGIRREAEKLVGMGFREIVLTGIHLGAYGRDLGGAGLADAVEAVLAVPGLLRLRLGSLESIELPERLLALMGHDPRICPHLHLPLQAGSDPVLRAMNRHYGTGDFARLVERAREAVPDLAVSTDIIVGFPGETGAQFEEGLAFARRMGFARTHVFPYSLREGTPAAKMPGQVPEHAKRERAHRMQTLAEEQAQAFRARFLRRRMDVLFETREDGLADGLTANYLRVYTDAPVPLNRPVPMRLLELRADGLRGEPECP